MPAKVAENTNDLNPLPIGAGYGSSMGRAEFLAAIGRRFEEHPKFRNYDLQFVRTYHARNSEVFEFKHRFDGKQAPILVKWRTGYSRDEAARMVEQEYARLEDLRKRSGSTLEGTIPLPLGFFQELGAIVTEKLPGRDFGEILRREGNLFAGPFRQKRLCKIARGVGKWLRKFHDSTRGEPQLHNSCLFMAEVEKLLQECSSGGMESLIEEEIWRLISRASRRAEGKTGPTAARHGDFTPFNILVDDDRIAVVDFEDLLDSSVIYEDVGMLRSYLNVMRISGRYWPRALEAMTTHFEEGYGDLEHGDLLHLHTVRAALSIAAHQFRRAGKIPKRAEKLRRWQTHVTNIAGDLLG